jgi:hypothetical protein
VSSFNIITGKAFIRYERLAALGRYENNAPARRQLSSAFATGDMYGQPDTA